MKKSVKLAMRVSEIRGEINRLARLHGIIARKNPDILRNGSLSARLLPQILEPQQHGQGAFQLAVQVHLVTG